MFGGETSVHGCGHSCAHKAPVYYDVTIQNGACGPEQSCIVVLGLAKYEGAEVGSTRSNKVDDQEDALASRYCSCALSILHDGESHVDLHVINVPCDLYVPLRCDMIIISTSSESSSALGIGLGLAGLEIAAQRGQ
jgi:hypothetical protein